MPRTHPNDHLLNLSHIRTKETKTKKYSFNEPYEAPGFKKIQAIILKGSIFIQIIFLKYQYCWGYILGLECLLCLYMALGLIPTIRK